MYWERGFLMLDVVIIGAGVSGCAIARELSRERLQIAVLEKSTDVCEGTSKANSGIAHAGFDAKPGTLMARLNLKGSEMMEKLSKELDFPYKKNGSLVLCFDEKDMDKLEELKERGEKNGVREISGSWSRRWERVPWQRCMRLQVRSSVPLALLLRWRRMRR